MTDDQPGTPGQPPQQPPPQQPPAQPPPAQPPPTGQPPVQPQPGQQGPGNGLAVAALVCGIVGAVLFWTLFGGLILGALGIIFGAIARKRATDDPRVPHKGLATAGLILGIVTVIGTIILWFAVINEAEDDIDDINESIEQFNEDFESDFDTQFTTP
jgi:hypothetical protein